MGEDFFGDGGRVGGVEGVEFRFVVEVVGFPLVCLGWCSFFSKSLGSDKSVTGWCAV